MLFIAWQFNISEILHLNEYIGYYLRLTFWPRSWKNGMVEYWNVGFWALNSHFLFYRQHKFYHYPFGYPKSNISPFRIHPSTFRPATSESWHLSSVVCHQPSVVWFLSSDLCLSSETFPEKASIMQQSLHVVASFDSSSRCCKLLKSDRRRVLFCHFVRLKILDKPYVEWYSLSLIHPYLTEFIGKFTVSPPNLHNCLKSTEFSRMGSGCCSKKTRI